MISSSRALVDAILGTGSFAAQFDAFFIKVYSGTVPTNPDPLLPAAEAALGAATLLCTYSDDGGGTGLTWDTPSGGIIQVPAATTVKGTTLADGTATFFRGVLGADDGSASTTALRIQGTVGLIGADMLLETLLYSTGAERTLPGVRFSLLSCQG